MKGFRNVLVYRYGRINDEFVFEVFCEYLDDIYEFIEIIEKFLEG